MGKCISSFFFFNWRNYVYLFGFLRDLQSSLVETEVDALMYFVVYVFNFFWFINIIYAVKILSYWAISIVSNSSAHWPLNPKKKKSPQKTFNG